MKFVAIILLCALASGCSTVDRALNTMPQVSADSAHLTKTTPYGSLQIEATNLQQTETGASADTLTIQVTTAAGVSSTASFKGYRRTKKARPAR